ncbi:hypothetical protein SGPA1_21129 [Streptomyces misionensis JCM 4497]
MSGFPRSPPGGPASLNVVHLRLTARVWTLPAGTGSLARGVPLGHSRDRGRANDTDQPKGIRGAGRFRGGGDGAGRHRTPGRGGRHHGDRHDQGRQARGDPHAGEPQFRPLLRPPEGRTRLRRPQRHHSLRRPLGLRPAEPGGPPVPVEAQLHPVGGRQGRRDPRPVQRRPAALLVLAALRVEQGPPRQLGRGRRQRPLARLPGPLGHPVPLRARRQLHHLRRLLLLHAECHRPQPHLPVERQGRLLQQRRRRRVRSDLADLRGVAPGRRRELEGLPERRRQLRRQRLRVLQQVRGRGTGRPAVRPGHVLGAEGDRLHPGRHRRRHQGRRAGGHPAAGLLGGGQPGILRAPLRPARRRRPLRQPRLPGPRRRRGRLRLHRAVPQLRRERRLLRPRTPAVPACRHGRRVPGRGAVRLRLPRPDDRHLALDARRLGLLGGLRAHLGAALPGDLDGSPRHARHLPQHQ